MIPQLVTLGYRGPSGRLRRLFVPVVPTVLILSPLLLLALLGGLVVGRVYGVSPLAALRGTGRFLGALPGTVVEIEDNQTTMLIRVR